MTSWWIVNLPYASSTTARCIPQVLTCWELPLQQVLCVGADGRPSAGAMEHHSRCFARSISSQRGCWKKINKALIFDFFRIKKPKSLGLKKNTWDSYNPTDPKLSSDPISYFYFYANLCTFLLNYANLCKFLCKFVLNFFDQAKKPCRMSSKLFGRNTKLKSSTLDV